MVEKSLSDVRALARSLYGAELGAMDGVLHVVAVANVAGAHRVIRIGPHAPKSETDFFVLNLARARVESILVTGAILRAEPELHYELDPSFLAYRTALGLRDPPWLLVLSRGAIDLSHPVFSSWPPMVFTGRELPAPPHIEVVTHPSPSARAAIAHLRDGCRSVAIEAGPRTAVPLYEDPPIVDELMLSVFDGELDPRALGGAFLSEEELRAAGFARTSEARRDEASGRWRFSRWIRSDRRDSAAGSR